MIIRNFAEFFLFGDVVLSHGKIMVAIALTLIILANGCIKLKEKEGAADENSAGSIFGNGQQDSNTIAADSETGNENPPEGNLCGNGIVDVGENCQTCREDAACIGGAVCTNGVCEGNTGTTQEQINACKEGKNKINAELCIKELGKSSKNPDFCNALEVLDKEECFKSVAAAAGSIEACMRIGDSNAASDCIKSIAYAENSVEDCGKITVKEKRDECIDHVARAKNDYSLCKGIAGILLRDKCIKSIILAKNNAALCKDIGPSYEGAYLKDNCYISLVGEIKECLNLTDKSREGECIAKATNSTLDENSCTSFKQEFVNDCIYKTAILKGDYAFCLKIGESDEISSQNCLNELMNSGKTSAQMCSYFADRQKRDSCYLGIAVARSDIAACSLLSERDNRNSCISGIAIGLNDANICAKIQNSESELDYCYTEIAVKKIDPEICKKNVWRTDYSKCNARIADGMNHYELCETITAGPYPTVQEAINDCYYEYAKLSGDKTVCANIKNLEQRNWCNAGI